MSETPGAFGVGLRFLRAHLGWIAALSLFIIIPCFWHPRIEAGDLPSHVYNAWLAHLVEQGKAPGLYTVWRWNNVLFDVLLLYSTKLFGFSLGPKIVVSLCALIFFWGTFAFVGATTGRPPWFLTPVIAMLTFGFTFNMGFFNYYMSVGLACFGVAILWRAGKRDWPLGALVLIFAVLAHPIGSLWLVATITYVLIRRKFHGARGLIIPAAAIAAFAVVHWYLANIATFEVNWPNKAFFYFNGADQLDVYGSRYQWISLISVGIFLVWLFQECFHWKQYSAVRKPLCVTAELYTVAFCITALLPEDLRLHPNSSWIGLVVYRITLVSAILALAALGNLNPRGWATAALTTCAAAFFLFLYQDTGERNRLEANVEAITAQLPYGTRVISNLEPAPDSRIIFIEHVVDRACIAHCFVYSNYEPSSQQFRVHVLPGSPVVTSSAGDSQEMGSGNYVVQESDPPLKSIYQCVPGDLTKVCIRDIPVGATTAAPEPPDDNDQ